MGWILNLVYVVALVIYSPWLAYRFLFLNKSRRGWPQKLFGIVPDLAPSENRRIWIHAVSVGEVILLKPLIERLQESNPNIEFVVSSSTEACRRPQPASTLDRRPR